jgi:hypothetical protein
MHRSSHSASYDHPNNILGSVQVMKNLLIMQCFPVSPHVLPLRPNIHLRNIKKSFRIAGLGTSLDYFISCIRCALLTTHRLLVRNFSNGEYKISKMLQTFNDGDLLVYFSFYCVQFDCTQC